MAERAEKERQERLARERERAEEERKERERQLLMAKQREEEARRLAEIKAAQERAEKARREEEERRRLAELRRKAEEERLRKAREEEARRIEMEWRQKIERARKILAWRLWRKKMHKHESLQRSRRSLESLDPTSTAYPSPLAITEEVSETKRPGFHSDAMITRHGADEDELESQIFRLATAPFEPINLAKMVAECLVKSSTDDIIGFPPTVQSNQNIVLIKLAVLLPKRTPQVERLYDTLRMWVNSHLQIGHVSSHHFKRRSHNVEVRAVAVIGNEDSAKCKDCNAALFLLPLGKGVSSIEFPDEEVVELLDGNVPRMVLVLNDEKSTAGKNQVMENILDNLVGSVQESADDAGQRQGVATPEMCHFDDAFGRCCKTVLDSYFESTMSDKTQTVSSHVYPTMVRVSLANLGFICLQHLIEKIDSEGCLRTSAFDEFFSSSEKTLTRGVCICSLLEMVDELFNTCVDIHQTMRDWPPFEFRDEGMNAIRMYYDGKYGLPSNWHMPLSDLKKRVFDTFRELLEKESFALTVERLAQMLPPSLKQNLLNMADNGDYSRCFANVVSLFASGELSVESNEEAILYLPFERMAQIIEQAAAFEAPPPQPLSLDIPSYLYERIPLEEEKENNRGDNINDDETPDTGKNVNKRKPPEIIQPDTPVNERVKRIRSSNPSEETEELTKSKEFTSFLEALL